MNICVLYYDGFAEFEVVLTMLGNKVHTMHNVKTIALENRVYISEEMQKLIPDAVVADINPKEVDMLILPGGDPTHLYYNDELKTFIQTIHNQGKWIAGICGGTEIMGAYGILDNKRCTGDSSGINIDAEYASVYKNAQVVKDPLVIDGNTICSMGRAYVEFAIEVKKIMGIYADDEEAEAAMKWLKNLA